MKNLLILLDGFFVGMAIVAIIVMINGPPLHFAIGFCLGGFLFCSIEKLFQDINRD